MASVDSFFAAAENRVSCYALKKESPVPDSRILEMVERVIQHTPSAFNVQSTRAVILLNQDHEDLWSIGDTCLKDTLPEAAYQYLARGNQGFKEAYGTVLVFEDQASLDVLKTKNDSIRHVIPEWSHHSNGMHQFLLWTAFELEGLGCNLQHYNFMPQFVEQVKRIWTLPESWTLHAQLVFGAPKDGLVRKRERTYLPLEGRTKMFGA